MGEVMIDHEPTYEGFLAAFAAMTQARADLDPEAGADCESARAHLEVAIAWLGELATQDDLPRSAQHAAENLRTTLSSHLLAARSLQVAGGSTAAVARLLRRGTEGDHWAAIEPQSREPAHAG